MFVVFNILIIGLILLIAYWWANQGLFSAILHLVCVIIAGAIALAFWEPVTVGLVLRGTAFDPYAWGIMLVVLFTVALLVLRVIADKVAPANVDLPHWANMSFGLAVGALSGVLTMGMFLLGAGHVHAPDNILGFYGVQRSDRTGDIREHEDGGRMWLPVHTITTRFYEWLSVTSLWSPSPLARVNPDLDRQATLLRDSYLDGRGMFSLAPDAASVTEVVRDGRQISIRMDFTDKARDFNEQFSASQAQVRLIASVPGETRARTYHPEGWEQSDGRFEFETATFYATSRPGQQNFTMHFFFIVDNENAQPRYIQVKGTRFPIDRVGEGNLVAIGSGAPEDVEISPLSPNIDSVVEISDSIRPVRISLNNMPTGLNQHNNYLTIGFAEFSTETGRMAPPDQRIHGIYAPRGTQVVKVRVDQGSPADIFGSALRERLSARSQVALIDSQGNVYNPIGYIHFKADRTYAIKLDPRNFVREMRDLPMLPSTGSEELTLLFHVTEGQRIIGMKFGDETIGRCDVTIPTTESSPSGR